MDFNKGRFLKSLSGKRSESEDYLKLSDAAPLRLIFPFVLVPIAGAVRRVGVSG